MGATKELSSAHEARIRALFRCVRLVLCAFGVVSATGFPASARAQGFPASARAQGFPAAARAQGGRRIAPLPPSFTPEQPREIASRFQGAMGAALEAARAEGSWEALSAEAVASALPARLASGCADSPCVQSARATLGVTYVVAAEIGVLGKNYTIDVAVHGARAALAQARGRCDICTLQEALGKTTELTRQALTRVGGLLPSAGATAAEAHTGSRGEAGDGAQAEPPAGSAGRRPQDPLVAPARAQTSHQGWPLWPALAAGGAALAGLAVGIPLLAIDGQGTSCRGEARDDYRNCERLYATSGGGWALTAMGIASLATAGVLLYLHLTTRPGERAATGMTTRQIAVVPTSRGVVLGANGSF